MRLYLVQHGEACSKDVDPERPLTDQGLADVNRLAAFVGLAGICVQRVIHSGKLRAKQTAECLASAIAPSVELITSDDIDPNDAPNAFDMTGECQGQDTLIVGHLPFMAKLMSHLLVGDENHLITAFQPGSMVCLQSDEHNHWQICWMIRPELLK